MSTNRSMFFWLPRILAIGFAVFISLFAFDTFGTGNGFWPELLGFLMHLVPVYALVAILLLAWRWELIGTFAYPALAVAYAVWQWGNQHWSAYVAICTPLVLIGFLFFIGWTRKKKQERT